MNWLCLGSLSYHHARQGLPTKRGMLVDFEQSLEFNGLGAHSFALSILNQKVTELRVVPGSGMPFQRQYWSLLQSIERELPILKTKRLNYGFSKVGKKILEDSYDCLFTREIWDYSIEFLELLKSAIPIRIVWLSLSPGRVPYAEIWDKLKYFTHIFLIDNEGVKLLQSKGYNAYYLPFALADYPAVRFRRVKKYPLSFLGTLYPNRMGLLRSLRRFDLNFFAPNFMTGTQIMYPDLVPYYRGEVWGMDLLESMARSNIIVNPVHRSYMRGLDDNVTNFRLFEAIGVGTFQFVENKPAIGEIFPSDEVETYSSIDELIDKIIFYSDKQDLIDAMVAKAYERVMGGHLYSHRMQQIIDIIRD